MKTHAEQTKGNRRAESKSFLLVDPDMCTQTHIDSPGQNGVKSVNKQKVAAKSTNLQGIIWYSGHPRTQSATDKGIAHAKDRVGC